VLAQPSGTTTRFYLVNDSFQRLLGRDADAAGLAAFAGTLGGGGRADAVLTALAGSDEYFARLA
jgi:hypothetical protein